MRFGVRARLLAAALALAAPLGHGDERILRLDDGSTLAYRVVGEGEPSAQPVAIRVLRHLAVGEIDEAAALSNEPERRREVLRDYLARVGEAEFKRVFTEYLSPRNRVVEELALGTHRLIVWDLAEADHRIAGQYYVEADGSFLMDDRPNVERASLQRVLEYHRKQKRR